MEYLSKINAVVLALTTTVSSALKSPSSAPDLSKYTLPVRAQFRLTGDANVTNNQVNYVHLHADVKGKSQSKPSRYLSLEQQVKALKNKPVEYLAKISSLKGTSQHSLDQDAKQLLRLQKSINSKIQHSFPQSKSALVFFNPLTSEPGLSVFVRLERGLSARVAITGSNQLNVRVISSAKTTRETIKSILRETEVRPKTISDLKTYLMKMESKVNTKELQKAVKEAVSQYDQVHI